MFICLFVFQFSLYLANLLTNSAFSSIPQIMTPSAGINSTPLNAPGTPTSLGIPPQPPQNKPLFPCAAAIVSKTFYINLLNKNTCNSFVYSFRRLLLLRRSLVVISSLFVALVSLVPQSPRFLPTGELYRLFTVWQFCWNFLG